MSDRKINIYAIVAILLTISSITYWIIYSTNAYNSFHEYVDLGKSVQSMYFHIYYPSVVGGLQYIAFSDHIAPDQLLVLPIFYLFQSPLTLLYLQDIVLSLTGLLIFYVARDILKDDLMPLLLCFTFLINPSMYGTLIYDYHAEFMIIPLAIFLFYFYVKRDKRLFYLTMILLLGAMELAPLVCIFLCAGLFVHSRMYEKPTKERGERLRLATHAIIFSIFALILYYFVAVYLINSYASSYTALPSYLKVLNYISLPVNGFIKFLAGAGTTNALAASNLSAILYTPYTYTTILLFFGFVFLFDPILAMIVYIPWVIGTLFYGPFDYTWYYFGTYALGGGYAATVVGLKMFKEKTGWFANFLYRLRGKNYIYMRITLAIIAIVISMVFIVTGPVMALNKNSGPLGSFLLQNNYTMQAADAPLNSLINMIPSSAPVMAEFAIFSHLTQRQYVETPLSIYFKPEYIIFDFNSNVSAITYYDRNATLNYVMGNNTYYLYAENGTAYLYKLKA